MPHALMSQEIPYSTRPFSLRPVPPAPDRRRGSRAPVPYSGKNALEGRDGLAAGAGEVYYAVLCSQGVPTEVPVAADIVGLRPDVRPSNLIEVQVPPYEDELGIAIRRRRSASVRSSPHSPHRGLPD